MKYKHPETAINGVINWLVMVYEIRLYRSNQTCYLHQVNAIMIAFLASQTNCTYKRGTSIENASKNAKKIQVRWQEFVNWAEANRDFVLEVVAKNRYQKDHFFLNNNPV